MVRTGAFVLKVGLYASYHRDWTVSPLDRSFETIMGISVVLLT